MKKVIFFLLIAFSCLTLACSSNQVERRYTKGLEDIFTADELDLLNKIAADFEKRLKEYYGSEATDNLYKQYTSNYTYSSMPMDFLLHPDSRKAYAEVKQSSLFDKIWILSDDISEKDFGQDEDILYEEEIAIPITGEDTPEKPNDSITEQIDFYAINPNGAYLATLAKNTQSEGFKTMINRVMIPFEDIAPSLIADTMVNLLLSDNDFEQREVQLFIVLCLYYTQGFTFDQMFPQQLEN